MEDQKKKLLTRIQESNNVLVTVSANPSLDQLAGAIGLTLLLNKLGKHATAVFSGEVPPSIEYLKPEETLEKDTNSLRDFIIALDKAKADKLRYKVEDKIVKIFITPYRTSLSSDDLEFSQGDFNVDLVIALGVHEAKDLDQAIASHGRILHDATVSSINTVTGSEMGTINWINTMASSLCEMLYELCSELKADALDAQMSTALLTGVVSETQRFSNDKTTAKTLDISAKLMSAGANQQLVAARLEIVPKEEEPEPAPEPVPLPEPQTATEPQPKVEEVPALPVSPPIEEVSEPKQSELPKPVEEPAAVPAPVPEPAHEAEPVKEPPKEEKNDDGALEIQHEPTGIAADIAAEAAEEQNIDEIQIDDRGNIHRLLDEKDAPANPDEPLLPPSMQDNAISKFAAKKEPNLPPINSSVDAPDPSLPDLSLEPTQTMPLPEPVKDQPAAPQPVMNPVPTPGPDLSSARDAVMDAVSSSPNPGPLKPRIDLNANPGLELTHDNPMNGPVSPPPLPPPLMPNDFGAAPDDTPQPPTPAS